MYISGGGGGGGAYDGFIFGLDAGTYKWAYNLGGGAYKRNFMVTNYPLYLPSVRPRWLS